MPAFAHHALVADEFQLSSEDRLLLGLETPGARGALSLPKANNVTLARLRYALANFAATNECNIQAWIESVAVDSPARALELYIELLQFSIPKQKAMAIAVTDASPGAKQLSLAELQSIVSEQ